MLPDKSIIKKIIKPLIITIFWLGAWQILSAVVGLNVLLPSPLNVLISLKNLAVTGDFWLSVLFSLARITIGFIIGTVLGSATAIISCIWKTVNDFLMPVIHIIKATPVASFIVLAVVWLKTGNVPSFTSALIVFPIVWMNIKTGVKETDKQLLEMSDAFNVRPKDKFKKIYIPSVKPYFLSATTTAMGLAWKSGIAAEVICSPKLAIGSGIYNAKIYLETPELFAWTAVVIVMSIIIEKLMLLILKGGKKNDNA